MRRLSFFNLLLCCLLLCVFSFVPVMAQEQKNASIISISIQKGASDGEDVSIVLSEKVEPKIFMLGGEDPRLVLDFVDAIFKDGKVTSVGKVELVEAVRTGIHNDPRLKTRIVIDLKKGEKINYSQQSSDNGKQVKILLRTEKKSSVPGSQAEARKENKKGITQVVAEKKKTKKAVKTAPVSPPRQLRQITFDNSSNKGEMVLFHLNDFYPPVVSAVEKDTPRIICDFQDMELGPDIEEETSINGKYIESVHLAEGSEKGKIQVILDLYPNRDYDLQQVFFKNDNLFVLIVNELVEEESPRP